MDPRHWTRRGFLQRTSSAALLAPALMPSGAVLGANDRLSVGVIGAGGRAGALMREIKGRAGSEPAAITAVCDVWKVNRERAARWAKDAFGGEPRTSSRYGELLSLDDVDAVVIATPDFAHTPILIAALEADKDAYVEKPMSLEIGEANKAFDLARSRKRVVQVGTQYRSHGGYRAAARELGSGVLGHVSRITAAAHFNQARWARSFDDCREADVDWEAYLFNRPRRPFDPRLLRRWQLYRMCTNGLAGLWMSHYVDAVHILTGAKYPRSACALGGTYVWKDGREHCDTFHALLEYPEGFLFDWAMSLTNSEGVHFRVHGQKGTLDIGDGYVQPNRLEISSAGGAGGGDPIATRRVESDASDSHMGNWLACIRSRSAPNGDIGYGHQHAVATIMTAAALHSGQRQVWDAEKREIREG